VLEILRKGDYSKLKVQALQGVPDALKATPASSKP